MNQKKNTKIIIVLIIITLILILIGGMAFAYLETDIFRSDKELFFKYVTQLGDSENGFINTELKQYYEKQKTTPYTDNGTFSVNIDNEKDFNISFSGQVDIANEKSAQDISLNYSSNVNFPISYKQIKDTIGLQTKYVGSKYVAIETNNLDKLSGNVDSSFEEAKNNLEKIQEIPQVSLTEEEKAHIQNTYMEVLNGQLSNDKFSKVKEANNIGYKLSLTAEDAKNILIQLLETLKNDTITLDKINEYLKTQKNSAKITISDIDDIIEEIGENTDLQEEKIEITVYTQKRKTNKLVISTQEANIQLAKKEENNSIKLGLSYESKAEDNTKISLAASYEGLDMMQEVKENYEVELQYQLQSSETSTQTKQAKYQYSNQLNFVENVNIEEFTNENAMILTDYEPEQVGNFLNAVTERIIEVNKQQMEELGLEENENPLLTTIIMPIIEISTGSLAYNSIEQTNISEIEVNSFNQKFEMYESTNQKAQTVKGLLSTIQLNNETAEDGMLIKEINFKGEEYEASEQNIAFIKEDIDMEKNYRVEFEKDQDTGIIYRVVINEK